MSLFYMKYLIVLSLLLVPLLLFAENKIKMVTYFPVPYVAYSKVNAQKQLDVGLISDCQMNLGCTTADGFPTDRYPLNVTTANLNKGKLELNNASAVKSTNVMLGSGAGEADMDFKTNLRLETLQNGYSLESDAMTVDELKLFVSHMRAGGEKFPSCAATGAEGAPQISWQKLKLKGTEEVYLMCGLGVQGACEPTNGGKETYVEACPSGQTGSVTYTWDYSLCKYKENSNCNACTWRYERWDDYPYDAVRSGTPQNAIYCPEGSNVETYLRWMRGGEMTRLEYVRLVCSPVVPKMGGAQVWIAQYENGPYRHCSQVDNPPVPTGENDLCIMESTFCNATNQSECPYRSVSLFKAVCK